MIKGTLKRDITNIVTLYRLEVKGLGIKDSDIVFRERLSNAGYRNGYQGQEDIYFNTARSLVELTKLFNEYAGHLTIEWK